MEAPRYHPQAQLLLRRALFVGLNEVVRGVHSKLEELCREWGYGDT